MYCRNCGQQIDDNADYCIYCGSAVNKETSIQQPQQNTLAIVGFVLSFFIAIAGLVCSIIGYKNAAEMNGSGKSLALAGIIISAVSIGLNILIVGIYIVAILSAAPLAFI